MGLSTRVLHAGEVTAVEYCCTARRGEAPIPEVHDAYSISYVRRGAFRYRVHGAAFDLVPGSVLVGAPRQEFVCSHEHSPDGDDCLSFRLSATLVDELVGPRATWNVAAVGPRPELVVLGELAQAVADGRSDWGLDEVGMLLAKRYAVAGLGRRHRDAPVPPRTRRKIIDAALWFDERAHEEIDLLRAAEQTGLSMFYFLRRFAQVVGVTPHQFLVRSRLRRAARLLAEGERPVTQIAFEVGFGDLSNFSRTFHRASGLSPAQFRASVRGRSPRVLPRSP